MTGEPTPYDLVPYPSTVFPATHPERLAMIARLHGLIAPPIETARVLEIGGGDGVNVIALAAAFPDARFHNLDLSSVAISRGNRLIAAGGLTNMVNEVGDIVEAAQSFEGQFDYVIAHGVYAWVPAAVRAALMTLIARVLAPEGVAFVSYNALPGGHLRRVIRDLLFHHVGHIDDPAEKLRRANEVLADFARPRDNDRPVLQGMRAVCKPMLRQRTQTLFHDELGDVWEPQLFADVVAAANAAGLGFLNDASPSLLYDGLPGTDDDDAAVVRAAQTSDYGSLVFFHQTLLVHAGRKPSRRVDMVAFAQFSASTQSQRIDAQTFRIGDEEFCVGDAALADKLEILGKSWPGRIPVADLAPTPDGLEALFKLFTAEVITLHLPPRSGLVEPGERPLASPLARGQVALGQQALYTLDHRVIAMELPGPRAFLTLLDGTRDRAQLATDWAASGYGHEVDVETALQQLSAAGFVVR